MKNILITSLLFLSGAVIGYFLSMILPILYARYFEKKLDPYRCAAGKEERIEPTPEQLSQVEEGPLPKAFEEWWINQSLKR